MQSREQGTAAQVEGFAQMFASRVFNNPSQGDAKLIYYKPIALDGWFDPKWPPQPVEMNNNYLWRNTNCPAANKGVEMDWMGFFYALTMEYTSDSVPMSDLAGLYRHACGGVATPANCAFDQITWGQLDFAKSFFWASNPDAINYWNFLSNEHGVAN